VDTAATHDGTQNGQVTQAGDAIEFHCSINTNDNIRERNGFTEYGSQGKDIERNHIMHLSLQTHGLPGRHHDSLLDLANRRAESALGRFADQVRSVVLRLSDVNGPKGGLDRRCVAEVQLVNGQRLVTHDLSSDWGEAVGHAMGRAAAMVKRLASRRRSLTRR